MGRGLIEEGYRYKLTLKPMVSYYILSIIIWKGSACGFRDWAHIVPAPEIKKICRLHNRIYTGYDYFDR